MVERFEAVLEVLVWRELKPGFRKREIRYKDVAQIRGGAANMPSRATVIASPIAVPA